MDKENVAAALAHAGLSPSAQEIEVLEGLAQEFSSILAAAEKIEAADEQLPIVTYNL